MNPSTPEQGGAADHHGTAPQSGAADPPDPGPVRGSLVRRARPYSPLLAIGLVAFAIQLVVLFGIRPDCYDTGQAPSMTNCWVYGGDTHYAAVQGALLLEGEGFGDAGRAMYGLRTEGRPGANHPPLFTVFFAALQAVGLKGTLQWRIVMSFVASLGVVLMGVAAWRLAGGRDLTGPRSRSAGIATAALAALSPLVWARGEELIVEGLLLVFIPLVTLAALRYWREPSLRSAALVGAMVGVNWLTRAELVMLLVFLAPLFLLGTRSRPLSRRVGALAVAGVVAAALMAPWSIYNLSRFNRPVFTSNNVGGALLSAACDPVYQPGEYFAYYEQSCIGTADADIVGLTDDSDIEAVRLEAALRYISHHKARTPVVMAGRLGRLFYLYAPGDTLNKTAGLDATGYFLAWGEALALAATVPLAGVGLLQLRRAGTALSPVLAPVFASLLPVLFVIPLHRLRTPADVSFLVVGGIGLDAILVKLRKRDQPPGS